jgi:hypothetical protein
MNRPALSTLGALASTVLALAGAPAHAALGGDAGVVIPYAGKLELDGALVTGTVDFEFGVAPDAVTAAPVNCVFTRPNIPVTNGEFSVSIPIPIAQESCVRGKDVHLVVRVARTGESLVLLGTQQVTPVVAAATSGPGDFAVTGALSAASAAVTGAVTAKSLSVNDPQSSLVADFNGLAIGSDTIRATGGTLGTIANQNIILVPKGSGKVEIAGPLQADLNADINGDLNVDGVLRKSGAPMILDCFHAERTAFPAGQHIISFTAAECGGTLPDNTYVGMAASFVLCGGNAQLNGWEQIGTRIVWIQGGACVSGTTAVRFVYLKNR